MGNLNSKFSVTSSGTSDLAVSGGSEHSTLLHLNNTMSEVSGSYFGRIDTQSEASGSYFGRIETQSEVLGSYFGRIDTQSRVNVVPQQEAINLLFGGTGFPVTGGSTVYIGTIVDTTESTARIALPALSMFELRVSSSSSPGDGESYSYVVMKNGIAQDGSGDTTDLSASISGADDTAAYMKLNTGLLFSGGDQFSLRVITSSGSATAYHSYSIKLVG